MAQTTETTARRHDVLESIYASHAQHAADILRSSVGECGVQVAIATEVVADALAAGHKVLACGNGGGATDAQHFVAELIGRYRTERRPLPAVSLTSDSSVVTALGNDYGFEEVFARQIEALAVPGDVVVVISTSGRSPNVLRAVERARSAGASLVAMTGAGASEVFDVCDALCRVGSHETAHIQEVHIAMLHSICVGVDQLLGIGGAE